jgi:C-1 hydroxylase
MKRIQLACIYLVVLFSLFLGCQQLGINTRSQELAKKVFDVINTGNFDIIDEFFAPGFVCHFVDSWGDNDIEGFKGVIAGMRTIYPDLAITIDEQIGKGDINVFRIAMSGTNTGPGVTDPPSGKKITLSGASIIKIADGKIIEMWMYFNELAGYRQLGFRLIPPASE